MRRNSSDFFLKHKSCIFVYSSVVIQSWERGNQVRLLLKDSKQRQLFVSASVAVFRLFCFADSAKDLDAKGVPVTLV